MEAAAPASAALSTPNQGAKSPRSGPKTNVAAKPVTAPISIMPSTPRLSTPLFSTTSSPVAASRIGVVTPTTVTKAEMIKSRLTLSPPPRLRPARRERPAGGI